MASYYLTFPLIFLLASTCYGQYTYVCSRATYYGSPDCKETATGACGFGYYGKTVNSGDVAGVSRLYRNGSRCDACYQVRCTIPTHCTNEGVKVVVTDYGEGDRTDFILTSSAYSKLARANMAPELFAYGVVDIEYKRIPCRYDNNVFIYVHEYSRYPEYLALVPLHKGGVYDIIAMDILRADDGEWVPMRRVFGTVFDIQKPPRTSLIVRLIVVTEFEVKSVQLARALPSDWKVGESYDTWSQLS